VTYAELEPGLELMKIYLAASDSIWAARKLKKEFKMLDVSL